MPEEMYRKVDARRLEALVGALFQKAGLKDEDAAFMGRCLVDADLRGSALARDALGGGLRARTARGQHQRRGRGQSGAGSGATAILDGDRGVGHIAVKKAMDLAIEKAREYGTATVSVRPQRALRGDGLLRPAGADAGCIGFAATTGGTMIAPWGGLDRRVGLNPISLGRAHRHGVLLQPGHGPFGGGRLQGADGPGAGRADPPGLGPRR